MKFVIDKVILWPKKDGLKYKVLDFEPDKINIITGASRTGKSAIIPIIDYCLGSKKCTIPVDTIRNATAWFGILVSLEKDQLLICRKEPGNTSSTEIMHMKRGTDIQIPDQVQSNTNLEEVKNILNELFSISFLAIDSDNSDKFLSRPSYRDFMAFLFQTQNVIANADVMFYKADTMEHRQKLINVFPYVLGAVTPQILAYRQELERLKKKKERLQKDLAIVKDVAAGWRQEAAAWLSQAQELGLIDKVEKDLSFDEQIVLISEIIKKNENETNLNDSKIKDMSDEIASLRKEEYDLSSKLFVLQKRHTEMLLLKDSVDNYEKSLNIQLQRLEISTWLKEISEVNGICPFCNSRHDNVSKELEILCAAISNLEESAGILKTVPAAFEREFQTVEEEMAKYVEQLTAIRNRIKRENNQLTNNPSMKYTLSGISRFLGRLENSLQTLEKIGKDSKLEAEILNLTKRIEELSGYVNEADIKSKQDAALKYINQTIGEIIKTLDVEHPDNPVEFLTKDLTLKVKNSTGRDDYLWEIGSASNWLSYHIATILAFQKFFQLRKQVAVPNFIVFDQPSQVYFPQRNRRQEDDPSYLDEDKEAVKKIFTCMDSYINQTEKRIQIIVTEHADEDIWGSVKNVHLVSRWRDGEKLIPAEWLV